MIWLVIAGVVLTLRQYATRHRPPPPKWQALHKAMIRQWARAMGLEVGRARRAGEEPDVWVMLRLLVLAAHPHLNPAECLLYGLNQVRCLRTFSDEELLRAELAKRHNTTIDLDVVREAFLTASKGETNRILMANIIVAAVVEEQFGTEERGKYLVDVLLGNAR